MKKRTCPGKIMYESHGAAMFAAKVIFARRGWKLKPYRCSQCVMPKGGRPWHLGHPHPAMKG